MTPASPSVAYFNVSDVKIKSWELSDVLFDVEIVVVWVTFASLLTTLVSMLFPVSAKTVSKSPTEISVVSIFVVCPFEFTSIPVITLTGAFLSKVASAPRPSISITV